MIQLVIGALILLLGLPFLIRGWVFTVKPEGKTSERAKERNLRMGLETDMKKWGRKVRRFGLLLVLFGGGLVAWGYTSAFAG
ncbi:MAG: hypothetical protein RMA76_34305 [Deltaproteobacteria bacterium]|jgi:hypothetical protein